jgi:hypothetical protein
MIKDEEEEKFNTKENTSSLPGTFFKKNMAGGAGRILKVFMSCTLI